MKNLLKFVLLIALFISSSSSVFSQTITNTTDCDFIVRVHYSYPAACDNQENINWTVPANSAIAIPGPAGSRATGAKGRAVVFSTTPNNCNFAITVCGSGPDDDTVVCAPCGTYTATIASNGNINIFN